MYLRGLRRCSDTLNEEDLERDTKKENRIKKCPIGGAFLDRDGNAAANIVQKLFLLDSCAAAAGVADRTSTASLANLSRGVRVQQKGIFWMNYFIDSNWAIYNHTVHWDKGVRSTAVKDRL